MTGSPCDRLIESRKPVLKVVTLVVAVYIVHKSRGAEELRQAEARCTKGECNQDQDKTQAINFARSRCQKLSCARDIYCEVGYPYSVLADTTQSPLKSLRGIAHAARVPLRTEKNETCTPFLDIHVFKRLLADRYLLYPALPLASRIYVSEGSRNLLRINPRRRYGDTFNALLTLIDDSRIPRKLKLGDA